MHKYGIPEAQPTRLPEKRCGLDTETTGLNPYRGARPFNLSISFPDGTSIYWHRTECPETYSKVCEVLRDPEMHIVMHNAKFDVRMLEFAGFPRIQGAVWDTMILMHCLDGRDARGGLSLDAGCNKYLPTGFRKLTAEVDAFFAKHGFDTKGSKDFTKLPAELVKRRVESDARLTLMLFDKLYTTVRAYFPYILWQEHRLLPVLIKAQNRGVAVDLREIDRQDYNYTSMIDNATEWFEWLTNREWIKLTGRDWQKEVLEAAGVYQYLETLPTVARTPKGALKLNRENLEQAKHPVAAMLLTAKAAQKMRDTFLEGARAHQVHGVLHADMKQCGTVGSRFASANPNLQNIPVDGTKRQTYDADVDAFLQEMTGMHYDPYIKRIFKVREGYAHVHSDKKQAEMVALAHYANDQALLDIVASGESIHDGICQLVYGQILKHLRSKTKNVVFGFVYGCSLRVTAAKIGDTLAVAREARDKITQMIPGLKAWQRHLESMVSTHGYVETIHGRRCYLSRSESYIAVNRMCQSTVGDEVKNRMIRIDDYLEAEDVDGTVLLNIHDDIGTEIPADETHIHTPEIFRIMQETDMPFRCPLASDCEITYTRWADKMAVDDVANHAAYSKETFMQKTQPQLDKEEREWAALGL